MPRRKVGTCTRLDNCTRQQPNAQEIQPAHEPPNVRLFCRPRLRALPKSGGTVSDANYIMTGKSTLLLMTNVFPHARDISSAIIGHIDMVESAMLRRKISSSPMKTLFFVTVSFDENSFADTPGIKAQLSHALKKNDSLVIFVDSFDDL